MLIYQGFAGIDMSKIINIPILRILPISW